MKRLIGRTDLEDALKKLDKLTVEEARMAVAENLKATYNVDERVRGVANSVAGVDDRVAKVDDRVAGVEVVTQQTANDVDEMKRSYSLNLISTSRGIRVPFRETITRKHSQMALPTGPIKEP